MQVVILCAGRGVRMGKLTEELPKVLISVGGKTLLEYKLDVLPKNITEIILVVGYKGDMIRERYGNSYKDKTIRYVEDLTLTGTAHALWSAQSILESNFIVMMGDDIYSRKSIEDVSKNVPGIVVIKAQREDNGSRTIIDAKGKLINFITANKYREKFFDGGYIFTGLYSLTRDIFKYEPVKMKTRDEWGLPQTLLVYTKDHPVTILETNQWIPVGTPEELQTAEKLLR